MRNVSGATRQERRPRGRTVVCALALVGALSACTASFDFERARRYLERPPAPKLPTLQEGPAAAKLPPPEGLRAVSGELRKVPLKWDPLLAGDVGGYLLERAPTREGPFERLVPIAGALTTTYIDDLTATPEAPSRQNAAASGGSEGMEDAEASAEAETSNTETTAPAVSEAAPRGNGLDGVTYFYRVRAFTPSGQLAARTSEVVAATTATVPAAPADLRAYSHQPRKVPLSWCASADPTVSGYRVGRSPTSRGPFEPVAEVEGRHNTTYIDQGLGDLRVFYYQVTSLNAAGGEGPPSEPVRAVTKPEPLPPVGLQVVERRLGSNLLGWEPNVEPDIVQYRLLRLREGAAKPESVSTVPHSSLDARDTEVGAGETVTYTLLAFDDDGLESAPGDPVSVRSEDYDLRAEARPDGVHLEWNPRTDEGYRAARIFRQGRLSQREFPAVTGPRFVDTDVKPGRSYRYTVALLTAGGGTAPRSAPVEIRVPPE